MIRLFLTLPVVVLLAHLVVAAPIPSEEKINIKLISTPKEGEVTIEKRYSKLDATYKFDDGQGGMKQEMGVKEVKTLEYEQTILKVENKKVVKFTQKYTKASIDRGGQTTDASYLNRTITYE